MKWLSDYFARQSQNRDDEKLAKRMAGALREGNAALVSQLWKDIPDRERFLNHRTSDFETKTVRTMLLETAMKSPDAKLDVFQAVFAECPDPNYVLAGAFQGVTGGYDYNETLLPAAVRNKNPEVALFIAEHPRTSLSNADLIKSYEGAMTTPGMEKVFHALYPRVTAMVRALQQGPGPS